jgi:hypothetical protein
VKNDNAFFKIQKIHFLKNGSLVAARETQDRKKISPRSQQQQQHFSLSLSHLASCLISALPLVVETQTLPVFLVSVFLRSKHKQQLERTESCFTLLSENKNKKSDHFLPFFFSFFFWLYTLFVVCFTGEKAGD